MLAESTKEEKEDKTQSRADALAIALLLVWPDWAKHAVLLGRGGDDKTACSAGLQRALQGVRGGCSALSSHTKAATPGDTVRG